MKKVLVIGANGQVGKHIVQHLIESKYAAVAMVRNEKQLSDFESLGAQAVIGDLEKDFSHAYSGCDAIIFAAGSGAHTGYDQTILIDQEGAIKAGEIAEKLGVKRFVMLSSLGTENPEKGPESLKPYLYAKKRADEVLKQKDLIYTIVRPGRLSNEDGNGLVRIEKRLSDVSGSISRQDVAKTLVECVENENTYYKIFEMLSGDQTITDALNAL
ncbi:SDR family oxidoreductase [Chengkuizengella axinellae]|uniref:SDR family oxidoreductase n=1 Tax=Chengkuizengella axinellae TaxID=3064388 RepID=A0ABT9IXV9_9BACL|nr:SDR family oxidoreductase [Chengkuizengella sp. 2205SS18-9]MDP5274195.1 SDR family oxidoreductase [Chengkuizengella sp. 2205SS18-9]